MATPALVAQMRTRWRASGLTVAQIAARADVHHNTVLRILNGKNSRADALFAVCRVLSITVIALPPAPNLNQKL